MKRLLTFIGVFFPFILLAQNQVHNGGFEVSPTCPTTMGQLDFTHVSEWYMPTIGNPDYFNTCALAGPGVSVPVNFMGTQQPYSGNAYIGFMTYSDGGPEYREYATGALDTLKVDSTYKVTIHVSLAEHSSFATGQFGIYFSTTPINYPLSQDALPCTPQVQFTVSPIVDSSGWVELSAYFVADSAYTNLTIGNFYHDSNTVTLAVVPNPFLGIAYYYCDSVMVIPVQLSLTATHTDVSCTGTPLGTATVTALAGRPPYTYSWAPGGQTTPSVTGLAAGTYTCTVTDSGGASVSQVITITQAMPDTPHITITATPDTFITPGQTITFTALPVNGGNNPTYQWLKNTQLIPNATNSTYITNPFTGDKFKCILHSNDTCALFVNKDTSNTLTLHINTGINNILQQPVSIYPNPTTNSFTLTNLQHDDDITLYNMLGEKVKVWAAESTKQSFDICTLPSGIYTLHIVGTTGVVGILRLIKQ